MTEGRSAPDAYGVDTGQATKYRCTCAADHCYWDTSDHPVDSGELCLHCHYLDFNEVCPAREEEDLLN